jgi:hypothetical protein
MTLVVPATGEAKETWSGTPLAAVTLCTGPPLMVKSIAPTAGPPWK